MKIKDVIISESPAGTAYQHNTTAQQWRDYAALQKQPAQQNAQPAVDPNNYVKKDPAPKKKAPKKQAPKKPVDAMAGSDASATNQSSGMTAQDRANATPATAPAATGQEAPSAELDRLKQLAIGGTPPAPAPEAPYGGAAANAMAAKSAPEPSAPAPEANPLGVVAQAGPAFGQPAPEPDKPVAQAAQPAPEPVAPAPATPDTVAPVVKTGTGGTLRSSDGKAVTSRSADEIAWAQKQGPMGPAPGVTYPGAGNWDPRTGRSTAQQAQADKNWQGIKNFFGFGKKEQPAAPAQQGQGAQPASGQGAQPGGYGKFSEETTNLRKLAGLE